MKILSVLACLLLAPLAFAQRGNDEAFWASHFSPPNEAQREKIDSQLKAAASGPSQCMGDGGSFLPTITAMSNFPDVLAKNIKDVVKNSDSDCLNTMASTLSGFWSNYETNTEKSPEFKSYCENNPDSKVCRDVKEKWKSRELALQAIIEEIHQVPSDESTYVCDKPYSNVQEILDRLNEYEKPLACKDLKDGESIIVNNNITGIGGKYTLKKREDGKGYDIQIGANFKGTADGVTSDEMLKRAQECIKEVSPFIKGPKGETLNLEILGPDSLSKMDKNVRPPVNNITIEQASFRSNSSAYSSKVDCSTIAHETMHLLGLCDEYDEKSNGVCRVVPKKTSLMSSNTKAYSDLIPNVKTCSCTSDKSKEPGTPWASRVCSQVMKGTWAPKSAAALKKFYLMSTFNEVTTPTFRNKYCSSPVDLPDTNWAAVAKNPVSSFIVSDTPNSIVVRTRKIEDKRAMPQEEVTCSCTDPNDKDCEKLLNEAKENIKNIASIPRKTCPSYTSTFNVWQPKYELGDLGGKDYTYDGDTLKIAYKPISKSLLAPNQFDRIVGGNCPEKGAGYSECAKFAYVNPGTPISKSRKEFYQKFGDKFPASCDEIVPAQCKDDSYYLGSEQ